MGLDERILSRLDELIIQGEQVSHQTIEMYMTSYTMQSEPVNQWGASCLNLFGRVFGEDSHYYTSFQQYIRPVTQQEQFQAAFGILKSAKDDYEHDMLFDARVRIEAEVFDDFLDQADYLLRQGYYQPAAVLAGAVLEDGLRKLCDRHNVPLPDRPKLDTINADLAKAGVYNRLTQKNVTALADVRNKAAHGKWDQFRQEDVTTMLAQIRVFMGQHFS